MRVRGWRACDMRVRGWRESDILVREWREGEAIVFDDSFEHEVEHGGDEPRVVLLINFFHPELPKEQWQPIQPLQPSG